MKCHYCDQPAQGRCSWPDLRFIVVDVAELRIGEVIRRWNEDQPRSSKIARVTALFKMRSGVHDPTDAGMVVKFAVYPATNSKAAMQYRQQWLTMAKAERRAPCNVPVCEAHGRELDAGKHTCSAHWEAWEKVA